MQKRHRIFIAINLPGEVKKALATYEQKFSNVPARWTPQENLHITLEFLGPMYDHELPKAVERAKEIAAKLKSFDVHLDCVDYGPAGKMPFDPAQGKPPRMLWATGNNMHVTLARISAFAWRQMDPEELPQLPEPIDLFFTAESVEVMESELKHGGPSPRRSGLQPREGGPKYTIIESIPLPA